jgi:uncharacterized cysteine cluster protein YcgN (CxxCxxCC family)
MNYPFYSLAKNEHYDFIHNGKQLISFYEWCKNPFGVETIIDYFPDCIDWDGLCQNTNPFVMNLIECNIDKCNWAILSANPNAIKIIKANQDKINWSGLSLNNCAYKLLKENEDKIDWINICFNDNPKIIKEIIAPNIHNKPIAWNALSENICDEAIEILKANPDKIDWEFFCLNSNDKAIEIIMANPDKINWDNLISNENEKIIEIFRNNQDKINWSMLAININKKIRNEIGRTMTNEEKIRLTRNGLEIEEFINFYNKCNYSNYWSNDEKLYKLWLSCSNSNFYKVDYEKMKKNFEPMAEEIIKEAMHPKRICKLILAGYDLEELF